ncbi:MFS transporter [Porticoccaceae bacterium]|nr:MFS transporter [Porticoccaceae bacterium]
MNAEQNNNDIDKPILTKWQALAFSSPMIGQAFLLGPMGVIQGIYAKYFGMALTTLAAVLLVGRIFDALTDPLIGHFSDRYRVRKSTRKPFVLLGGLLIIPCSYFLFVPPEDVGVAYFMLWTLLFYLSTTLLTIPMNAWGSEIGSNSVQRTTLFTAMMFVAQIGGVLFYLVPFLPMFTTTEITPETLKISVFVGAVLILPGLYCALKFLPDGPAPLEEIRSLKDKPKDNIFQILLIAVKHNKPFQIFMAAYMCSGLGLGMCGALLFIYIDAYLGEGAIFAQLSILGLAGGLLLTPLAYKVVIIVGKKKAWMISTLITLVAIFYLGLLSPGHDAYMGLVVFYIILTFGGVSLGVIAMPMFSETVDYALLSDKTERRAAYFSVFSMMVKANGALGMAIGLAVAGWLGFDANATTHDAQSGFAIHMAVSWLPVALGSLGLFFIWKFPLDERRSAIIYRRLAGRSNMS